VNDFPDGVENRSVPGSGSSSTPLAEIVEVSGAAAAARLCDDHDLAGLGRIGLIVKIAAGENRVYGHIRAVEHRDGAPHLCMDLFGEYAEASGDGGAPTLSRGISHYPVPGDPVFSVSDAEMESLLVPHGSPGLRLGTIYPTSVPAVAHIDNFLSKHFAVLGSTGTGKSSAVALIIHRLVENLPGGHILILDPHNEYATAFRDIGEHFDPTTLSLPYWLMNLEEHVEIFVGTREAGREVEVDILKRSLLAARKKNRRFSAARITVDTPIPYKLSDLTAELEDQMGRLEKPEKHLPFLRLKHKIEELRSDDRYSFMFSGMLISDSFGDIISRILRMPGGGKPVSTLDLSGVPSDIVDVVVSVLCRMVFDFALWSRKSDEARPLLLVCEEAHRYVPRQQNPRFDSARRVLERIAKEGRKYGVALGLVSQRPSDISESVLSQCGTILSMRMNNERDAAFVASALPEGSAAFLQSLSALKTRECILSGEGVAAPMRVYLDHLDAAKRPSSADPAFATNWAWAGQDPGFVPAVIDRWRSGKR